MVDIIINPLESDFYRITLQTFLKLLISLVDYKYKVEVFIMGINTNYTNDLMISFIDDALYHAKKYTTLVPNEKIVNYEIIDSKPLIGHIRGIVSILDTSKNDIREVNCNFNSSSKRLKNIEDHTNLSLLLDASSDGNTTLGLKYLTTFLSKDFVTLSNIEKYVVKELNEKGYYPNKK